MCRRRKSNGKGYRYLRMWNYPVSVVESIRANCGQGFFAQNFLVLLEEPCYIPTHRWYGIPVKSTGDKTRRISAPMLVANLQVSLSIGCNRRVNPAVIIQAHRKPTAMYRHRLVLRGRTTNIAPRWGAVA